MSRQIHLADAAHDPYKKINFNVTIVQTPM